MTKPCPKPGEKRGKDGICPSMRPWRHDLPMPNDIERSQKASEWFWKLGGIKAQPTAMRAVTGATNPRYRIPKRR